MCAVLYGLRDRGFCVDLVDGKLRVSPRELITEADRELIRSNRKAILEALTAPPRSAKTEPVRKVAPPPRQPDPDRGRVYVADERFRIVIQGPTLPLPLSACCWCQENDEAWTYVKRATT